MKDLLKVDFLSTMEDFASNFVEHVRKVGFIELLATADLEGVLSIVQVESALIDSGISYRRRFLSPSKYQVREESSSMSSNSAFLISIDSFGDPKAKLEFNEDSITLTPISVSFQFDDSAGLHHGVLDCVSVCALIAAHMSPESTRVRRLRPLLLSGQWLRHSLESNYDPVFMMLCKLLAEEGSVRVVPITEISATNDVLVPDLSERRLNKLRQKWNEMNSLEREQSLSELVLPALRTEFLSTGRIEELVWHRIVSGSQELDLATQLHRARESWPQDEDNSKVYASRMADKLISQGHI